MNTTLSPPARVARDSFFALQRLVSVEDLSVVFQPIVNLASGSLFAYEALVRCSKPELKNPLVLFERAVSAGCVGRSARTGDERETNPARAMNTTAKRPGRRARL